MISKDLVAASSRPMVLSILLKGKSYGYEIIQKVRVVSEGQLQWTDGMLYPVLHRLEREGLIKAEWQQAETGRRRKYYELTRRGRAALDEELEQWTAVDAALSKVRGLVAEFVAEDQRGPSLSSALS